MSKGIPKPLQDNLRLNFPMEQKKKNEEKLAGEIIKYMPDKF